MLKSFLMMVLHLQFSLASLFFMSVAIVMGVALVVTLSNAVLSYFVKGMSND